jgi:hypothetical protein
VATGIVAGLIAALAVVGLALSSRSEAEPPPAPPSVITFAQQEELEPQAQEQPSGFAESEHPLSNRTVEDLLAGVIDARKRDDRAWLARSLSSTTSRKNLTQDDLHTAFRQFLWVSVSRLWMRVETAWAERKYTVTYDGEGARATFEVGGALGEVWFDFVRVGDGWFFAGI